jgi:hypothetical protein
VCLPRLLPTANLRTRNRVTDGEETVYQTYTPNSPNCANNTKNSSRSSTATLPRQPQQPQMIRLYLPPLQPQLPLPTPHAANPSASINHTAILPPMMPRALPSSPLPSQHNNPTPMKKQHQTKHTSPTTKSTPITKRFSQIKTPNSTLCPRV